MFNWFPLFKVSLKLHTSTSYSLYLSHTAVHGIDSLTDKERYYNPSWGYGSLEWRTTSQVASWNGLKTAGFFQQSKRELWKPDSNQACSSLKLNSDSGSHPSRNCFKQLPLDFFCLRSLNEPQMTNEQYAIISIALQWDPFPWWVGKEFDCYKLVFHLSGVWICQ